MNKDLKVIKKKYGEGMMHFCRSEFSILLEEEGLLLKLLMDNFHESHNLYDDIKENGLELWLKNYIYGLMDVEKGTIVVNKTPEELMTEAGYILKECFTEEEIQSYKKYYAQGEQLCTFHGGRLERCRVFFAVKKDVENIKREDFSNPRREDEYGTSVISIQFTRDGTNTLSIKNRYNHRVNNPDATFSNNLDNIIPGLTEAFEKTYGIIQKHVNTDTESLLNFHYVMANDGKFYKYNYEINNIYYCPDNIIIDNFEVKRFDKSKYLVLDYFILELDNDNKKLKLYDLQIGDTFGYYFKDIDKIDIINTDDGKEISVRLGDGGLIVIIIDKDNRIVGLNSETIREVGDRFLYNASDLAEINLPNLVEVGDYFLNEVPNLEKVNLPNLNEVGNYFLVGAHNLKKVNLPNLNEVGDWFLVGSHNLKEVNLPSLVKVGDYFLNEVPILKEVELPNLVKVGDGFLRYASNLEELNLPNLNEVGDWFLVGSHNIRELNLPSLVKVGDYFLNDVPNLEEANLPKLVKAGDGFLRYASNLEELNLPNLVKVGENSLEHSSMREEVLKMMEIRKQKNNLMIMKNELINGSEDEIDINIERGGR